MRVLVFFAAMFLSHAALGAPLGPTTSFVSGEAFAPARAWEPGMSQLDRTRVVVVGGLFSLTIVGCMLIRSQRGMLLALGSASAATVAAIVTWQSQMPRLQQTGGDVVIVQADPVDSTKLHAAQVDRWRFFGTRSNEEVDVPLEPNSMRVECDDFPSTDVLRRGDRAATIRRTFANENGSRTLFDTRNLDPNLPLPWLRLVNSEYPALKVVGAKREGEWTTVVLRSMQP